MKAKISKKDVISLITKGVLDIIEKTSFKEEPPEMQEFFIKGHIKYHVDLITDKDEFEINI